MLDRIGDYQELFDDASKKLVNDILEAKEVKAKLYAGIKNPERVAIKDARTAFAEYLLSDKVLGDKGRDFTGEARDPSKDAVKLEDLLGSEGVKLYKAAIEEERNDPAFRQAVFAKSLHHYDGPAWKDRVVLWVAGPSASGKTFGANAIINEMSEHFKSNKQTDNTANGNTVAFVDGGIERELSQMRQLTLQVALAKGYPGIQDLHKNTKLNIKKHVQAAANASSKKINLVIPATFTNPMTFKKIYKYSKQKDTQQIFSEVAAPKGQEDRFRQTVQRQGEARAYKTDYGVPQENPKDLIKLNVKPDVESKKYQKKYFDIGKNSSKRARKFFSMLGGKLYFKYTNDFVYAKYNDKSHRFELSKEGDKGKTIGLSQRDFDEWKKIEEELKKTPDVDVFKKFNEWLKNPEREPAKPLIETHDSAQKNSKIQEQQRRSMEANKWQTYNQKNIKLSTPEALKQVERILKETQKKAETMLKEKISKTLSKSQTNSPTPKKR